MRQHHNPRHDATRAQHERRHDTNYERRRRVPRPLVWTWAVAWPVIAFVLVAFGQELTSRIVPGATDVAANRIGVSPISLRSRWPGDQCEGGSRAWTFPDTQAPADVFDAFEKSYDGSLEVAVDNGGTPYGAGLLTIYISAYGSATVVVEAIDIVVYETHNEPPDWAAGTPSGCGGGDTDTRLYTVQVDVPNPQLKLTEVNGQRQAGGTFKPFEASAADPTTVMIDSRSCGGTQSWGLIIRYSVNGREYQTSVGSPDAPFRITGGQLTDETDAYVMNDDGQWVTTAGSKFNDLVMSEDC